MYCVTCHLVASFNISGGGGGGARVWLQSLSAYMAPLRTL